jgi:hypothetical protein
MSAGAILLLIAIICWFVAAINHPTLTAAPVAVGWLGLFFYGISLLVGK